MDHHEHVRRSSLQTVSRYRTATEHLLRFIEKLGSRAATAANLSTDAVEEFVRWLRSVDVSPNGHANSKRRKLLDKGIVYVLDCCRSMFNFAIKRRHLPPYADNPFSVIQTDAITIENAKPIVLLSLEQEQRFLNACDDWDYPIFLSLMLTGLRPGELCHLLLPVDLNLEAGILRVSNKPRLGWQIKTRCDHDVPLHPALVAALKSVVGSRTTGAVFRRKQCANGVVPSLERMSIEELEREVSERIAVLEQQGQRSLGRQEILHVQRTIWRDLGAIDEDDVRRAFICICKKIQLKHQTAPKVLRHGFATMLQDANVDPLVRNLLMGHSTASSGSSVVRQVGLGMDEVGKLILGTFTSPAYHLAGLMHAISVVHHVFGTGIRCVSALHVPRKHIAIHLDYGDRQDRPSEGVVINCSPADNPFPNPTKFSRAFAAAYGSESAIQGMVLDAFSAAEGAARILEIEKDMVRTQTVSPLMNDMVDGVAVGEGIRRSVESGKPVCVSGTEFEDHNSGRAHDPSRCRRIL